MYVNLSGIMASQWRFGPTSSKTRVPVNAKQVSEKEAKKLFKKEAKEEVKKIFKYFFYFRP